MRVKEIKTIFILLHYEVIHSEKQWFHSFRTCDSVYLSHTNGILAHKHTCVHWALQLNTKVNKIICMAQFNVRMLTALCVCVSWQGIEFCYKFIICVVCKKNKTVCLFIELNYSLNKRALDMRTCKWFWSQRQKKSQSFYHPHHYFDYYCIEKLNVKIFLYCIQFRFVKIGVVVIELTFSMQSLREHFKHDLSATANVPSHSVRKKDRKWVREEKDR